MTPGSADGKEDAALVLGQTYHDVDAQVLITPVLQGGESPDEYIDVVVNLGDYTTNNAPTGSMNAPSTANVRSGVLFQGEGVDIDGDTLYYTWNFGAGEELRTGEKVAYSFKTGGDKTVTLTINDAKGGMTEIAQNITISDPTATWSSRISNAGTKDFRDICVGKDDEGNDMALAISYGDFKTSVSTSYDGVTWTTSEINASNLNLYAVAYTGTHFIGVGDKYDFSVAAWVGNIWTSADGVNWTSVLALTTGSTGFDGVASNGSTHVAVGDGGQLYYSTDADASTWTSGTSNSDQRLYDIAYGGGAFVAVGGYWNGSEVRVVTSGNGTIWTDYSSGAGVASWNNLTTIEYLNDAFVSSGWYSGVRTSTDLGQTFSTTLEDRHITEAMAYGNGIYFANGVNKDASDELTDLYSTDGTTWAAMASTVTTSRNAAVFFADTFITVGDNGEIWQTDTFTGGVLDWESYQTAYLSEASTLNGFLDDFDGDGVMNGIEHAKGTDPTVANDFTETIAFNGEDYPTYTFDVADTVDVATLIEVSYDLVNWTSADVVEVSNSEGQLTVRSTQTTTERPEQFFRVNYYLAE